jgi:hypothetical protein
LRRDAYHNEVVTEMARKRKTAKVHVFGSPEEWAWIGEDGMYRADPKARRGDVVSVRTPSGEIAEMTFLDVLDRMRHAAWSTGVWKHTVVEVPDDRSD